MIMNEEIRLVSKNGNEVILINSKTGKAHIIRDGVECKKRSRVNIVYGRYTRKIEKIRMIG